MPVTLTQTVRAIGVPSGARADRTFSLTTLATQAYRFGAVHANGAAFSILGTSTWVYNAGQGGTYIQYGNNFWLIATGGTALRRTVDGLVFVQVTPNFVDHVGGALTARTLQGFIWTGARWLGTAFTGTNLEVFETTAATSHDGSAWRRTHAAATVNAAMSFSAPFALAARGTTIIAPGIPSGGGMKISRSTDSGATFSEVFTNNIGQGNPYPQCVLDVGGWFLCSQYTGTGVNGVARSTDGANWSLTPTSLDRIAALSYFNGNILALGGGAAARAISYSANLFQSETVRADTSLTNWVNGPTANGQSRIAQFANQLVLIESGGGLRWLSNTDIATGTATVVSPGGLTSGWNSVAARS